MDKLKFRKLFDAAMLSNAIDEEIEVSPLDVILDICEDQEISIGNVKRFIDGDVEAELETYCTKHDILEFERSTELNEWF